VLNITKDFQRTESAQIIVRFCITVNGHEIAGYLTASAGYHPMTEEFGAGSEVEFDPMYGVALKESGLFTPEEIEEIEDFVIESIELPIIPE